MAHKNHNANRLSATESAHQKFKAARDKTGIPIRRLVDFAADMIEAKYLAPAPKRRPRQAASA